MTATPNPEQAAAITQMLDHLRTTGDDPYFKLLGPAGCGKTFTTTNLLLQYKRRVVMTAPTNKAVRVIREALRDWGLRLECRTIYSLLGLKMGYDGEVKVLQNPEDPIDLGDLAAVFVDEAWMLNSKVWEKIREAQTAFPHLRWVFMGDPFQLPPVKEKTSPTDLLEKGATLSKIMRQDNQILTLSQHLREMVQKPFGKLALADDNDGEQGVWRTANLDQAILNQAQGFHKGDNKAIAWRNVTVDRLNQIIRQELFEDSVKYPWQLGDRITLLEPAKDLDGEVRGSTDEEGAVEAVDLVEHPVHKDFQVHRIVMRSDLNTSMTLFVLAQTPKNKNAFELRKARLAAEAKVNRAAWRAYWNFLESFHTVRHAYAITAHRAQGSTYQRAFVSWRDILLNQDRGEAMRCLYVAATRPKKELYLG